MEIIKKYYESLGYKFTNYGDEFEVKVEDLPKGSNIKVEYICDECKELKETKYCTYYKMKNDCRCQKCKTKTIVTSNRRNTKLKNGKSLYDWCIKNNRKDILEMWDYELNSKSPKEVTYGCGDKFWFKCLNHKEHGSFLKSIDKITREKNKNKELFCLKCHSIAQWFIDNNLDINDYWDFEKNTISPWEISCGNRKKIWIKCQHTNYHESNYVVCSNFCSGKSSCPYCSHKKIHPKDSLGQYIIDKYGEEFLWSIWSDKNKKSPFEYAIKTGKELWWKCANKKHDDYLRTGRETTNREYRCPKCSEELGNSIIEENTKNYLKELGYNVFTECNCTIIPINPKTKYPMPFDNEILLSNGKHLIIEVHGEQHYKIMKKNSKFINKKLTPEEYLHQRQLYDRYKRMYAKHMGYEYLGLPYWTFDKKETYKQMIDDKINEILNISKTS